MVIWEWARDRKEGLESSCRRDECTSWKENVLRNDCSKKWWMLCGSDRIEWFSAKSWSEISSFMCEARDMKRSWFEASFWREESLSWFFRSP